MMKELGYVQKNPVFNYNSKKRLCSAQDVSTELVGKNYFNTICKIDDLYKDFLNDLGLYLRAWSIIKCLNDEKQKFLDLNKLLLRSHRGNLTFLEIRQVERYLLEIINGFSPYIERQKRFLNNDADFKKATNDVYDSNRGYRMLAIMRNIVQHTAIMHVFYSQTQLVIDKDKLIESFNGTRAKFENAFGDMRLINVIQISKDFENALTQLAHQVFIIRCDIDSLKRLKECLSKYRYNNGAFSIRTQTDETITYEMFEYEQIRHCIELYNTIESAIKK